MNTNQYLYFDELSREWKPTTLAELAVINDPDLRVCPVDADGNPGQQTTYAQITRSARPLPAIPKKPEPQPEHAPAAPMQPTAAPSLSSNDLLIRYTMRYIAGALTFIIFALCIIGGLASGQRDGLFIGFFMGAMAAFLIHIRAKRAASSDKI